MYCDSHQIQQQQMKAQEMSRATRENETNKSISNDDT